MSSTSPMDVPSQNFGMSSGIALSIPRDQWVSAYTNPNATGRFPIDGYDITKPFPVRGSFEPIDGWSLDLNITNDISTRDIELLSVPRDAFFAGATVRLTPPDSLVTTNRNGSTSIDLDPSWFVCVTYISPAALPQKTLDAGRTDDGSCGSMLGEACAADLVAQGVRIADGGSCGRPAELPESCRDVLGAERWSELDSGTAGDIPFGRINYSIGTLLEFSPGTNAYYETRGNRTQYDAFGQTRPVIISWGSRDSEPGNGPKSSLACVRATETANEESVLPGAEAVEEGDDGDDKDKGGGDDKDGEEEKEEDDSAGGRVAVTGYWALVGAVAIGLVFSAF